MFYVEKLKPPYSVAHGNFFSAIWDTSRVATAQGKQGIWFLLFPDRENTGNIAVIQGTFLRHGENIFDCIYHCKKHVSLHIFSNFFSLALLRILSNFR